MADYFIDFNRGNDSPNDGLSPATAWKNLSKIAAPVAAGDNVFLASDSVWSLNQNGQTLTLNGNPTQRIRIGRYFPLSASTGKPTIRANLSVASGSWTYTGANGIWVYSYPQFGGTLSHLLFGPKKEIGIHRNQYDSGLNKTLPRNDREWGSTENVNPMLVYVWTGSAVVDPTTYYGQVLVASSVRGCIYSYEGLRNYTIENLRFEDSCWGVCVQADTGAVATALILQDCEAFNCSGLVSLDGPASTAVVQSPIIRRNYGKQLGSCLVQLYQRIVGAAVYDNLSEDTGLCNSQVGAIELQCDADATGSSVSASVYRNTIRRARYGVGDALFDGCGIYAETGTRNALIFGNTIEDCHLAMQDNSGRTMTFVGNVARRCYGLMKWSDETSQNNQNLLFANNTAVDLGFPTPSQSGVNFSGPGFYSYDDSPAPILRAYNNIMVNATGPSQPAFRLPPTVNAASVIGNNYCFGYSAVAGRFDNGGAVTNLTQTGNLTTDPRPHLDANNAMKPTIDIGGIPFRNPLDGAGTWLQGGRTFDGAPLMPGRVPIGAKMPSGRMP